MTRFAVVNFRLPAEMKGLEAHLITTATAWANGEGHMKPASLKAFLMLLMNEKKWFCADNPGQAQVDLSLTEAPIPRQEIVIQVNGRLLPSAKVKLKENKKFF